MLEDVPARDAVVRLNRKVNHMEVGENSFVQAGIPVE